MQVGRSLFIFFIFQCSWLLQAQQPITLFCHGIIDNENQSQRFQELLEQPIQTFNFQDVQKPQEWDLNSFIFQSCSLFGKFVNRNKMFMGQGQDVFTLAEYIDPTKEYIVYGVSRGGATAINYIADYNPSNIKALILDATPADMMSSVDILQYSMGYKFAPDRIRQENIFNIFFPSYEIGSTPPIDNIAQIKDKDIPIFIVHSMNDSLVSIASAWQFYLAFKNNGFDFVYLCQLPIGKHSFYMQGQNKDLYLHALHSFYKKYNFAYNKKYADMDLAIFQPSIEEITEKLTEFQKNLEKLYNSRKFQLQTGLAIAVAIIFARVIFYRKDN